MTLNAAAAEGPIAMAPRTHAVTTRVGVTFVANVVRAGLSFASGLLVARSLGPSSYGDLNFLLGSFAAIGGLLDMGASSAFYTFLAQRRRSRSFVLLYGAWMAMQFVVPVALILALPHGALSWIWLDHSRRIVLLAFIASFLLTQIWGSLTQLAEARRLTVFIQWVTIAQASAHLALVAAAAYLHWLSLTVVLFFTIGEYLICLLYLAPWLTRSNMDNEAPADPWLATAAQFWRYCRPMFIIGWFAFAQTFFDRWLLQRYGGSIQQGFFSVANQFAMIGGLLTASVMRVLWKELAEASQNGDARRVQYLYDTASGGLFFSVAWIACLLIPYADQILGWTLGPAFTGAALAFSLMLFYPIHQAMGQAQATFFYASEDTSSYARIGMLTTTLSVPITYLVLAPGSAWLPGLGLGAAGLAMKLVGLNVVSVSVQGYVIARRHGWSTGFPRQAAMLACLLGAAWAARATGNALAAITSGGFSPLMTVAAGVIVYGAATLTVALRYPAFTGLEGLLPRLLHVSRR